MSTKFSDFLDEQIADQEFKKEYDVLEQEGTKLSAEINANSSGSPLTETTVKRLESHAARGFDHPVLFDGMEQIAQRIFHTMEPIATKKNPHPSEYREIWVRIPRGSIDSWCAFEDFRDVAYWEEIPYTRESWENEFKWLFPDETYWHLIRVNKDESDRGLWLMVAIDEHKVIEIHFESRKEGDMPKSLEADLLALEAQVQTTMQTLADGTYGSFLQENLPFNNRWGIVARTDWWAAQERHFPDAQNGLLSLGNMGQKEALAAAERIRAMPKAAYNEMANGVEHLTTRRYFDVLKEAYKASGHILDARKIFEDDRRWQTSNESNGEFVEPEETPLYYVGHLVLPITDSRTWYGRFGDDRDSSLFEFDPDDADAFRAWWQEKNAHGCSLDHNFEVFRGRGCTRVDADPVICSDTTWCIRIHGSVKWHAADMAHLAFAFIDAGIPAYFYDADRIADALAGEDMLLVVPEQTSPDYLRGEYFGHEISTTVVLPMPYEEDALLEFRNEIIAKTEWQPVEHAVLSSEG